jgi:hypothetical protein
MKTFQEILKEAQNRHKSYVDVHIIDKSYKEADKVYL